MENVELVEKVYYYVWSKDNSRRANIKFCLVYYYVWSKDNSRRANIKFCLEGDTWVFDNCEYKGVYKVYDIDDWTFLYDLSKEIINLYKKIVKK